MPIIYLDTNVLSALVHEQPVQDQLTRLVLDLGALVGVSLPNIAELVPATRIHRQLVELLMRYPAVLLKPGELILAEEVEAYPSWRSGALYNAMVHDLAGKVEDHWLLELLADPRIARGAEAHRRASSLAPDRHAKLQDNFPPSLGGKYQRSQAKEFSELIALQWLIRYHPQFVQRTLPGGPVEVEHFRSVRMLAYLIFWRFYLNRRTPNPTSDLGDLAHSMLYPYCGIIVVENDAAESLRQVRRHTNLLENVEILTLRDLRK